MNRLPALIILLVVMVALLGVIRWQSYCEKELKAEARDLREKVERVESMREENERMAAQLKAAAERRQTDSNDLAQLRARAPAMTRIEEDNARLWSQATELRKVQEQKAADNFDGRAALHWVTATLMYARAHQGQFPANLEDVIPTLKDSFLSSLAPKIIETTNRYELVYHGTMDALTNPPPEAAIIIRARQAWQNTNGNWVKEYGMGNGTGQTHSEPDGNFEKYESARIPK